MGNTTAPDKKSTVKKVDSQGVSVNQLAADIGVSFERLITQFKDAGITVSGADAIVSEEEKQ